MEKNRLLDIVISDEEEREEQIHELIKGKQSLNINTELSKQLTLGQRMSDKIATFTGSWPFLGIFSIIIAVWAVVNTEIILHKPFDPYPYVFLNLILACISSIQAPIIMMSQNRESQKDRLRSENDYLINLKSEILLEDLHMKIDDIIKEQNLLKKELRDIKMEMEKSSMKMGCEHNGKDGAGREKPGLYS
ncbi:MAG: DUF1003 domain-containing protein [Caulobacteraceae bacterium]